MSGATSVCDGTAGAAAVCVNVMLPVAPPSASIAVMVHEPGVVDAVYVLVAWLEAFVLPGRDAIPHDPAMLGVELRNTGSFMEAPEPVLTIIVRAVILAPSAGRLVLAAATKTVRGGGEK
jgi:hypothetical protein